MNDTLAKIYYSTNGYWKGSAAINKLTEASKVNKVEVKNFLSKQAIWQIYLPPPRKIVRPKFENYKPNDTHQIDLLYLPHDKIRNKRYKYALTVVDVASRYKDAEPLSEKSSVAVSAALTKIYSRGPLRFPRLIQCDNGAEFKGSVNQLLLKHQVLVHRGIVDLHRAQGIVENFNRQLSERLFAYQYHQEMLFESRNTEWVNRLPSVLKSLISQKSPTGLSPVDAISLKNIPTVNFQQKDNVVLSLLGKKV